MEEQLEAEKKEAFLKEYLELCMKHGYSFQMQPPVPVRTQFIQDPPQ